jgi:hypothetical protein
MHLCTQGAGATLPPEVVVLVYETTRRNISENRSYKHLHRSDVQKSPGFKISF